MFVGRARHAEVNRLVDLFDEVRTTSKSRLLVYSAPAGWGKTRIVQEFYSRLAAGQPAPAYWPTSLVAGAQQPTSDFVALTVARKTVRHREVSVAHGATLPWLWLAPPSGRLGDGSPAPVLDGLTHQITRHLEYLMRRLERRKLLTRSARRLIAAAVPLPDLLELAETAVQVGDELIEEHTRWRRERRQAQGERRVTYDDDIDRAAQVCNLLDTLISSEAEQEPIPVVLVLDDAHNLDSAGASFVSQVLATDMPVLVIATTWPDRLASASPDPFAVLAAEAAASERVTSVDLDPLFTEDLVDYVRFRFPATDPQIATRLAERAGRNPYALRLLLDTPRVRSATRDERISLRVDEVDELNGGLDSLLGQHWAELSLGVRQVLVAAALLGESFIDEVLVAGLGRVRALEGVDAALASSWIRATGGAPGMLEFVERMRFEIARSSAADVLSGEDRMRIFSGALSAVRTHLGDGGSGDARQVLLTLHVTLARAGVETDLAAAAASAQELADRVRNEHRRQEALDHLTQAAAWLESVADRCAPQLVRAYIDMSTMQRAVGGRLDGEPAALRALEVSDTYLAPDDEWRIRARCSLSRCRRIRRCATTYQSGLDVAAEAERMLADLPAPSPEVVWDVTALRGGIHASQSEHVEALKVYRVLLAHCENHFGRLHRWTLETLEDIAYSSLRTGQVDDAIAARRQLLIRRTEQISSLGYLQTLATRSNLAFALLAANDDRLLDEVEQLVNETYDGWCRLYGVDGKATQRVRLIRARLWQRQGLRLESLDTAAAMDLFRRAARETARIVELRGSGTPGGQAIALTRLGTSLACLRDPEAIRHLEESLQIRSEQLRQDRTFWGVRDCAEALSWAYQRLGRSREAAAVARLYRLPEQTGRR